MGNNNLKLRIINSAVDGSYVELLKQEEIISFLKRITIKQSLEIAKRADRSEIFKIIFSSEKITLKQCLESLASFHHNAMIAILLDRNDVVSFIKNEERGKVLQFIGRAPYWQIWEIFLERQDLTAEEKMDCVDKHSKRVNNYNHQYLREKILKMPDVQEYLQYQ